MRRFLPVLALGLAACSAAGAAPPRPLAAEIVRAVLVVHLSDGTRCVALTPFTAGNGAFGNCPGLSWSVTADPRTNPLRRIVEEGFGLIGVAGALRPMALIEVTDAGGRVTGFVSPPPAARR
jgi:hypothetical protein